MTTLQSRRGDRPHGRLIYRHMALVVTYSINVVFPAIAKAEGPLLAFATIWAALARLRDAVGHCECLLIGVDQK